MAIEAPISKCKKTNLKIYIIACLAVGLWCVYDGYLNKAWIEEHTNVDGTPQAYLVFNRKAAPIFIGAAVLFGAYIFAIRNKKLVADENELIISDKEKIAYDSIQKIDKTHFNPTTGYFVVTYKNKDGREVNRKISSRTYDGLPAVLDELVAKIS
jgi:hypothetical protein